MTRILRSSRSQAGRRTTTIGSEAAFGSWWQWKAVFRQCGRKLPFRFRPRSRCPPPCDPAPL